MQIVIGGFMALYVVVMSALGITVDKKDLPLNSKYKCECVKKCVEKGGRK